MKNLVAIVGKPNVGKSTLFNKLAGKRISIVHDEPGVTRDRLYHDAVWLGKEFKVIDTGGIEVSDKPFQEQITIQAQVAIEEANVIIFMMDGREEITKDDRYVLQLLRKSGKPILVAMNKLEGNKEFDPSLWSLGVDNIFSISAIHGEGLGDLLDQVTSFMKFDEKEEEKYPRLAIIGRPNAGKSSLLNYFAGEERSIVSEIEGTTRDSVDAIIDINGTDYKVVDTAGINKKSKLIETVDHYALNRAMNSLDEADLSVLVIDATKKLHHFDARLAGYAMESIMPILIVVNKWDLIKKETMTMKRYEEIIRKEFKFMRWAPILFVSAKTGSRMDSLKEKINEVKANLKKEIKTAVLNEMIIDIQMMQPAPSRNGGRLNISFVRQVESRVPSFLLFVNNKRYLHFTYQRYIENQFREHLGFEGTPIRLIFKSKKGGLNE